MKFECDSCQAQYMIADEKLGARGVKVKCKRCSHVIIVRPAKSDAAAAASPERDTFVEREPGTTPDGADGLGLGDDDLGSFGLGPLDDEPTRATFDADTEVAASGSSDNDTIAGDPPQPAPAPLASDESTVVGPAPRLFDQDDGPAAEDDNPFLKQQPAAADFGAADSGDDDNPFQGLGDLDNAAGDASDDDEGAFGASAADDADDAPAPNGFGLDDEGDLDLGRDESDDDEDAHAAGGAFDAHASADDDHHDNDVTSPSSDAAPRDASLRMDSELDANPFFGSGTSDDDDQQGVADEGGGDALEPPPPAPPPADAMPSLADDGGGSMPSVGGADDLLEGELAGAFGAMFAEADERGPTQVLDLGRVDQLRAESQRSEIGGAASGGLDELRSSLDSSLDDSFAGVGAPWGAGGGGGATLEGPALGSLESEADDDDEGGWHAAIDDEDVGPLTLRQMGEHIKQGGVDRETLVWRPGMEDWTPAGDIREVRPLFDAVPRPTISPSGEGAAFDVGSPIDDLQPSPFGSDEGNAVGDPFGALPGFDTADSEGAWQPHGLTEVYQAANLAEAAGGLGGAPAPAASAASGSASGGLDDDDDDGGWKPGAGNALASLVSSEIERLDTPGFGESSLPPAADDSLSLNLDNSPLGGLSSGLGGLDLADPGSDSLGGGFGATPVSPVGLGGAMPPQASLGGMPMTPYAAAPTSPLKNPLVLIAGVGGTMIMLLFVVVLLLVFREPAGPVVAQQPVDAVSTAGVGGAAVAAVPVPAAANPAVAAAVPTPAEPAPSEEPAAPAVAAAEAAPETKPEPAKADAPEKKPTRVAAAPERKPQRRAQRRQQPRQEPKPRLQQVQRTRNCDPVLDLDCDEKPLRQSSGGGKTELSPSDVLGVIKRNLRTVDGCAAKHGAKGTIKMEWRILKSGNTSSVRVATPSFANTPVGNCVESAVKRWKFPASSKPPSESVKFPFKLKG